MPEPLYMQLLSFTGDIEPAPLVAALQLANIEAVVYEDVSDPSALGLVTLSEDPAMFVSTLRPLLRREGLASANLDTQMTMFGRTYLLGYEQDHAQTLHHRPRRHLFHPDWPWAVWYPLRRSGQFNQLPEDQQKRILKEHGQLGRQFAEQDLAHDIRLACHGLDRHDNDFIIGLTGQALTPLSELVQTMRQTEQTSRYLEHLGPFFVGRKVWQSNTNNQ